MSKHRSHLYILTGAFVALVAGVLGSTVFSNGLNVMPLKASTIVDGTLTFNASHLVSSTASSVSGRYNTVLETTTNAGATYQLHILNSTTQLTSTEVGTTIGNITTFDDVDSQVYLTSSYAPQSKTFQKIKSISITSKSTASRTLRVYFNGQDTYDSFSASARATTSFNVTTAESITGNARTFSLKYVTSYNYNFAFSEVSVTYDCDPNYSEDTTLSSIALSGDYKTEFAKGSEFNYEGLVVTAHYSDLSEQVVTPTSVTSPDMSTTGEKTITVSYTEGGITKSAEYTITVSESVVKTVYTVTAYSQTATIDLTTSSTGTYSYNGETLGFSYVISGSTITFTLVTPGGIADMANARLFSSTSAGATNSGTITLGTSIVIKTYNAWGTGTNRTFTTD